MSSNIVNQCNNILSGITDVKISADMQNEFRESVESLMIKRCFHYKFGPEVKTVYRKYVDHINYSVESKGKHCAMFRDIIQDYINNNMNRMFELKEINLNYELYYDILSNLISNNKIQISDSADTAQTYSILKHINRRLIVKSDKTTIFDHILEDIYKEYHMYINRYSILIAFNKLFMYAVTTINIVAWIAILVIYLGLDSYSQAIFYSSISLGIFSIVSIFAMLCLSLCATKYNGATIFDKTVWGKNAEENFSLLSGIVSV